MLPIQTASVLTDVLMKMQLIFLDTTYIRSGQKIMSQMN